MTGNTKTRTSFNTPSHFMLFSASTDICKILRNKKAYCKMCDTVIGYTKTTIFILKYFTYLLISKR